MSCLACPVFFTGSFKGIRVQGLGLGFRVLGFRGFGVSGFWGFGVLVFRGFGVLGFWGFGVLGFWVFGFREVAVVVPS